MNKKIIALGVAVAAVPVAIFAHNVYLAGHDIAMCDRFPHLDPELVTRAHRELLKRSFKGEFADIDLTDEFLDAELIKLVESYQK